MGFSYRTLIFGGRTFCCCLPVRFGVICMSILGCLVAGILTIFLWFEVSVSSRGSSSYAAFVLAAIMETVLLLASMLGLFGSLLKHRSLIKVYAYILYAHFVVNCAVAAYLLIKIFRASRAAEIFACQTAVQDPQAQDQCTGLLDIAKWVYVVVAFLVLFIELYGAVVVKRYLNQVEHEKAIIRSSRMDTELAFRAHEHRYTQLHDPTNMSVLAPEVSQYDEFDPYAEHGPPSTSLAVPHEIQRSNSTSKDKDEGYGGGTWTHADLQPSSDDKKQLQEQESQVAYHDASKDLALPLYSPTPR